MQAPRFGIDDVVWLNCKNIGRVKLSKATWQKKISKPEREHIRYNYHKLVETLQSPDDIRRSRNKCFYYYKGFPSYWIRDGISAPAVCQYFVVVVDLVQNQVKTFYPTDQIKGGDL